MRRKVIKRAEIWAADLRKSGIEISKIRPVLVVSANYINVASAIAIVVPLSSRIPQILGLERIFVGKDETNLVRDSVVLALQIRALDKSRLMKKIGKISGNKMLEIEESLKLVLGMIEI